LKFVNTVRKYASGDENVAERLCPDKISVIGGWEAVSLKG
jgi:hypothetical protein